MSLRLSIVVPCYNEAHRFPREAFLGYRPHRARVSFVLVDDGSTDATRQVLDEVAEAGGERFQVLALAPNRGKAEAVRLGMQRALEARPDAVGFWDADLATPLEAIEELGEVLARRPGVELVFGARAQLMGREIERSPARHYLGRLAATAISASLGLPIYDTQCGAKLFRAGELTAGIFAEPFLTRWLFDVELVARAQQLRGDAIRALLVEVPLQAWRDVKGSKVRPGDYLRALGDLWRIRHHYRR